MLLIANSMATTHCHPARFVMDEVNNYPVRMRKG